MSNTFVWVDIPVADLDRAIAFYGAVTAKPVDKVGGPGFTIGLFRHEGSVIEARHSIAPNGFRAIVTDGEGNRIALHSMT